MRKLLMSLIVFLGSAAAVLLVFFQLNNYSPSIRNESSLPDDIAEKPYILTDAVRDNETMLIEYSLPCIAEVPDLSIVVAASYPFSIIVENEVIYSYASSDPFRRVHIVELGHEEYFNSQHAVTFANYSTTLSSPILLIGGNSAVVKQAAHSYGIQMFSLGAQTLILFYAIYLFYRKKSERYLLLLLLITSVSMTISVISLSYPILDITDAQYRLIQGPLNMVIRAVVILMCVKLTNVDLPGKLEVLLKWYCFVPLIGLLLILNKTSIPFISKIALLFMDQGYLIALAALLYAAYKGKHSCYPLLAGLGAMQGVYYYYRIVSTTAVIRGAPMVYFYVGQFGNLFFVLACMMVATARLAANFQASENTAEQGLTLLSDEQAARRGMMTNIFHDLRSPLFIMKGCLDQLEDVVPADNKTISVMRERLDFQEQLISDLFLAARLEEGKLMITDNSVNITTLCREAVETYKNAAQAGGVELSGNYSKDCVIGGERFRVEQVLQNLIVNALQHTKPGGKVTLIMTVAAGYVSINICDTGSGIPPEELPHVFERYYHVSRADDPGSTGLGLSIARDLTVAMHGELGVVSEMGCGSCFTLVFPLVE